MRAVFGVSMAERPGLPAMTMRHGLVASLVIAGAAFLTSSCDDMDQPPARMTITALQYERGVFTVALELQDSWGREVKADGRAFIEVLQDASVDGSGARTTIYSTTRD